MRRKIYLIGSLRNPEIPKIAELLRSDGHRVFDDWYSAGEKADDAWKAHQQFKCMSLSLALMGPAAQHILAFDRKWLDWCDTSILVMPAGKSGHLELGYAIGQGKDTHILLPGEPEVDRWDVMYGMANGVWTDLDLLMKFLDKGGN